MELDLRSLLRTTTYLCKLQLNEDDVLNDL
jgi:hypothetical protein